jgi:hypothetical protein
MHKQPTVAAVALGVVLTLLVNAIGIWVSVKLLASADIVDWELDWPRSSALAIMYVTVRAWNNSLFNKTAGA